VRGGVAEVVGVRAGVLGEIEGLFVKGVKASRKAVLHKREVLAVMIWLQGESVVVIGHGAIVQQEVSEMGRGE